MNVPAWAAKAHKKSSRSMIVNVYRVDPKDGAVREPQSLVLPNQPINILDVSGAGQVAKEYFSDESVARVSVAFRGLEVVFDRTEFDVWPNDQGSHPKDRIDDVAMETDQDSNVLAMIKEWRKGCSCCPTGDPWECRECTVALIECIEKSSKKHLEDFPPGFWRSVDHY